VTAKPLDAARDALIALQGQLIGLLAAQNAALAAWVAEVEAANAELAGRVARLERAASRNSLLTEQRSVFSQLNGLMAVSGYTVTGHDRRAGTGPRGAGGGPGGQASEHRGSV
jgi:hypothetical protein